MAKPKNRYLPPNPLLPQKNWFDMTADERELWSGAALLRAFQLNTNPHVLPDDVRALIADEILAKVDKEAVTAAMVDGWGAYRAIKFLVDHLDECSHSWLRWREGDEERAQQITTLDAVKNFLEDMAGVLGAQGFPPPDEEEGE